MASPCLNKHMHDMSGATSIDVVSNVNADQSMHRTTALLHYTSSNTWKLLPPQMAFPPWLLCYRNIYTGTRYSPQLSYFSLIAVHVLSLLSVSRLQQAWEREQAYCYFSGQKHLPYGTGDKTKNSGTVPDVSVHLATMQTRVHRTLSLSLRSMQSLT